MWCPCPEYSCSMCFVTSPLAPPLMILKVERALSYWATGCLVLPPRGESQFSESNWGESTIGYLPSIWHVSHHKYKAIIQGAKPFCRQRKILALRSRSAATTTGDDRSFLMVSSDVGED